MKLSELIAAVGDDHAEFQVLRDSLVQYQAGKHDATVMFATEQSKGQDVALDGGNWFALVVWLPNERLPEEIRELLRKKSTGEDSP